MRLRLHFSLAALLLLLAASFALLRQPVLAGPPDAGPAGIHDVFPGGSIQAAIDAASPGDTVLVHAGTYTEHITVTNRVSIYGAGWSNTILNGNGVSNTSVIYIGPGVGAETVISGLQVTRGHNTHGGCIRLFNASPVIKNTWVNNCRADFGGGVYVNGGAPTFDNVPAWLNEATVGGGGFYIINGAVATISGFPWVGTNGTLLANKASTGGAIHVGNASVALSGLRMAGNSSAAEGGAVQVANTGHPVAIRNSIIGPLNVLGAPVGGNTGGYGGGVNLFDASDFLIESVWFEGNASPQAGGAIRVYGSAGQIRNSFFVSNTTSTSGGGLAVISSARLVTIAGNWFERNTAGAGGGLSLYGGSNALIDANGFFSNTAQNGGGIDLYQSGPVTVTNNIIARNEATIAGHKGAGISAWQTGLRLVNNTIHDNYGDGIWIGDVPPGSSSRLANNIITFNTDSGIEQWTGEPSGGFYLHDNDVYLNHVDYVNHSPGMGDLSIDPRYQATGPNMAAQLHLRANSPVSVTGSVQHAPLRDIDGDWRFAGGTVSMGADDIAGVELRAYLPIMLRH